MNQSSFDSFWVAFSGRFRPTLSPEMRQTIRECCFFAWSDGFRVGEEHERENARLEREFDELLVSPSYD